ncbi:MAG: agmatine deiminase [Parvibaculaceae bacterium]|nr:agmatine deiminase [Parvibaculaceae bacterium]
MSLTSRSTPLKSTPRADGFHMPGEFEPHAGTWMLWPERPDTWRLDGGPAQAAFTVVAEAIAQGEPVTMGVSSAQMENARAQLSSKIRIVEIETNDAWMRDMGPSFLVNDARDLRCVDWQFNAWGGEHGGLYAPWDKDQKVARAVAEYERVGRYEAPLILEGGAIHVDGQGTLLTTEECLLNANRNPSLNRGKIEQHLKDYLGIEKVIWLGKGVFSDETDGHVDNLSCFIRPACVVLTWTDDQSDPQYDISHEAFERLSNASDSRGRALEIHKLHQPAPLLITKEESAGVESVSGTHPRPVGERLAASYVNFYIGNGTITLPTFDDPNDARAAQKLAELFPERQVTTVPGREILLGGGNIHCITQQQPR